jgi:hypothetical protein
MAAFVMALLALVVPLAFVGYRILSYGPPTARLPSLQAQGQVLVDAAERYKAQTGRYPNTVEQAGVATPVSRYGRWQYKTDSGGKSFSLSVGDYERDGFVMYWTDRGWSIDQ